MQNETQVDTEHTQVVPVQESLREMRLKSIRQLLLETWVLYRSKFKTVIGIMLVPVILSITLNGLNWFSISSPVLSQSVMVSIVKIGLWLVGLYASVIAMFAVVAVSKDSIGIRGAFARSIKRSFSDPVIGLGIVGFFAMLDFSRIQLIFVLVAYSSTRSICASFSRQEQKLTLFQYLNHLSDWKRDAVQFLGILLVMTLVGGVMQQLSGGVALLIESALIAIFVPYIVLYESARYQNLVETQQYTVREFGRLRRVLYRVSIPLAVVVLFFVLALRGVSFMTQDISNPDDSDLQLSAIDVPKEQNSFYVFQEAKDLVYWPEDVAGETVTDIARADEILRDNEQAMTVFEKAVSMSVFQEPSFQNPKDYDANMMLPDIAFMRNLSKVNSLKVESLLRQGREKEAFDQAMKTMKMGKMMQDGQNSLIDYLSSLVIKENGLNSFRSLLQSSHLSSEELIPYGNMLGGFKENNETLSKIFKGEYIMTTHSVLESIDGGLLRRDSDRVDEFSEIFASEFSGLPTPLRSFYYYKPNKTKLLFIEMTQEKIANAYVESFDRVMASSLFDDTRSVTDVSFVVRAMFTENFAGKEIAKIVSVVDSELFVHKFQEDFSLQAIQVLLALKGYKQDTGSLPNSLDALVPKYISETPQDPFDGKSMKYDPEKKIVYSVGKDLVDNGGDISEDDWKNGDDLGFKVEF